MRNPKDLINTTVKVRGEEYVVVRIQPAGTGKFFGKSVFTLWREDGTLWKAFGKDLAHNSRLIEA